MTRPLRVVSPVHKAKRQLTEYMTEASRGHGVEPGEGHLLSYTTLYGPCPVSELTSVFGFKPSTLTGILDRLEAKGLLVREPNEADRRSFLIRVTDEGAETATTLREMLEELEADVMGRVSERDMEGFDAVMRAVADVTRVELRPTKEEEDA